MYLSKALEEKWADVLDTEHAAPIKDPYKRAVTAVLLENEEKHLREDARSGGAASMMLNEASPTNSIGSGAIATYNPILISLIRRQLPNLIAYDMLGVQPMTGPTGLIFCMKSRYVSQTGTEAFFNEANTVFSGKNSIGANGNSSGSFSNTDPTFDFTDSTVYGAGFGMPTSNGESLGSASTNHFPEMAFSIDSVQVTARERALKAEYSLELAQDLKALHGLDAEVELANILSTEILAELNREVIRTIYRCASLGAQWGVTTTSVFDLDTDANGRWAGEKFKGLYFQIQRECGALARATRRGRGNHMLVSSDVASALAMVGALDWTPAIKNDLQVDDTGNTFAGVLTSGQRVYIDPYFGGAVNGNELVCVGYKGSSPWDAGLFYCPYVPLQMMRAVGENTFQPKIAFKCRYGMVANPFATTAADGVVGDRNNAAQANIYYRIFKVKNLL